MSDQPTYQGKGDAVHVEVGSFDSSGMPVGPVTSEAVLEGKSQKVTVHEDSPAQFHDQNIVGQFPDSATYRGRGQAVHVFGDVTAITPPPPFPVCTQYGGGGSSVCVPSGWSFWSGVGVGVIGGEGVDWTFDETTATLVLTCPFRADTGSYYSDSIAFQLVNADAVAQFAAEGLRLKLTYTFSYVPIANDGQIVSATAGSKTITITGGGSSGQPAGTASISGDPFGTQGSSVGATAPTGSSPSNATNGGGSGVLTVDIGSSGVTASADGGSATDSVSLDLSTIGRAQFSIGRAAESGFDAVATVITATIEVEPLTGVPSVWCANPSGSGSGGSSCGTTDGFKGRSVSGGWGRSDSSLVWTTTGGVSSSFSVAGGWAIAHVFPSIGNVMALLAAVGQSLDTVAEFDFTIDQVPVYDVLHHDYLSIGMAFFVGSAQSLVTISTEPTVSDINGVPIDPAFWSTSAIYHFKVTKVDGAYTSSISSSLNGISYASTDTTTGGLMTSFEIIITTSISLGMTVKVTNLNVTDIDLCSETIYENFDRSVAPDNWGGAWTRIDPGTGGVAEVAPGRGFLESNNTGFNVRLDTPADGPWSSGYILISFLFRTDTVEAEFGGSMGVFSTINYGVTPSFELDLQLRSVGGGLFLYTDNDTTSFAKNDWIADAWYYCKIEFIPGATFKAKVWLVGDIEPDWQQSAVADPGIVQGPISFFGYSVYGTVFRQIARLTIAGPMTQCTDPNNSNIVLPPFAPGYLPIFRRQIGDPTTSLDGRICTLESGAMVLDWQTRSTVQVWGGELIPYCGRTEADIAAHGTNLSNVRQAWSHWSQYLQVCSGQSWAALLGYLAQGCAVILQGDYGTFSSAEGCQAGFTGDHAISLYPYITGPYILVGDPLCHDFHGVLDTSLQAYAEQLGLVVYGATSPQKILFAVSQPWVP